MIILFKKKKNPISHQQLLWLQTEPVSYLCQQTSSLVYYIKRINDEAQDFTMTLCISCEKLEEIWVWKWRVREKRKKMRWTLLYHSHTPAFDMHLHCIMTCKYDKIWKRLWVGKSALLLCFLSFKTALKCSFTNHQLIYKEQTAKRKSDMSFYTAHYFSRMKTWGWCNIQYICNSSVRLHLQITCLIQSLVSCHSEKGS